MRAFVGGSVGVPIRHRVFGWSVSALQSTVCILCCIIRYVLFLLGLRRIRNRFNYINTRSDIGQMHNILQRKRAVLHFCKCQIEQLETYEKENCAVEFERAFGRQEKTLCYPRAVSQGSRGV